MASWPPAQAQLTHRLGFFTLGVENGELELGSNFRLVAGDKQQIQRQIVLAFFIQALRINSQTPAFTTVNSLAASTLFLSVLSVSYTHLTLPTIYSV